MLGVSRPLFKSLDKHPLDRMQYKELIEMLGLSNYCTSDVRIDHAPLRLYKGHLPLWHNHLFCATHERWALRDITEIY